MSKLIAFFILISSFQAWSQATTGMSDKAIANKLISSLQDSKVQKQIEGASEFTSCKADKLKPGMTDGARAVAITEITKCFKEKIRNKQGPELEKLSDKLGLQSYGLIQNKSADEITNYLSKKVSKSLTGVDQDEKDLKTMIDNMKFGKTKLVDPIVYFQLYQTQLGKNILFELSRYCYEDFAPKTTTSSSNFRDYWKDIFIIPSIQAVLDLKADELIKSKVYKNAIPLLTDTGSAFLSTVSIDPSSDKSAQYDSMINGFQGLDKDPKFVESFFSLCSRMIRPLCDEAKERVKTSSSATSKTVETAISTVSSTLSDEGARSCVTMARLEQYKVVLGKVEEYIKLIKSGQSVDSDSYIALSGMQVYENKGKDSIDNLTGVSTNDILESQDKKRLAKLDSIDTNKCKTHPEDAECDSVLQNKDDLDFELANTEIRMTAQDEAKIQRIRELKEKDAKPLLEYLRAQGYSDIAQEVQANPGMTTDALENLIRNKFDTRRTSYLLELKKKAGEFQVQKGEDGSGTAENSIKAIKEDQGKLAQLVMFNNIVSSSFSLKTDKGVDLGRNTSGLEREINDAKKSSKQAVQYFEGLKGPDSGTANKNKDFGSITGLDFLNPILGIESGK